MQALPQYLHLQNVFYFILVSTACRVVGIFSL